MHTGYVAFLDVLGFSALVAGEGHAARINSYLSCLSKALDLNDAIPQVEYIVFSDSIIITTADASEELLLALLKGCSCAFGMMLKNEIPVRGAISHGTYISETTKSGRFVAGRAIIEAYQFEEKQDWIGIMLAPSVFRNIPDLRQRCLLEDPHSPEILERLLKRLTWAAYVQPCSIPFHGNSFYDGFALVPSNGDPDPVALRDSLFESLESLQRLKFLAPDPAAQDKYDRSSSWVHTIQMGWNAAVFRREQHGL